MKRFVTALTVIIATAAIVLAIMPTTFADNTGFIPWSEWRNSAKENFIQTDSLKTFLNDNHCELKVSELRCGGTVSYENENIVFTITQYTDISTESYTLWDDVLQIYINGTLHNHNTPIGEGIIVKFILPDGTIYYDTISSNGTFRFDHRKDEKGKTAHGYDEHGNASSITTNIGPKVIDAMSGFAAYITENEYENTAFRALLKSAINNWHYNPNSGMGWEKDLNPSKISSAAKGTFYEDLITEWVNKVNQELEDYTYWQEVQNGNTNVPTTDTPVVTETFKDVATTHWAKANIKKATDLGAFAGYEDGTFRPENEITHEEFLKVIISLVYNGNVANAPTNIISENWADWAKPYLNAAIKTGIVTTADTDLVTTGTPITRAEMAKIISRALAYLGKQVNSNDLSTVIADWNTIPDEYKPYITQAYTAGILAGYEDNTFKSANSLTRAEASSVIVKLVDTENLAEFNEPTNTTTENVNTVVEPTGNIHAVSNRELNFKDEKPVILNDELMVPITVLNDSFVSNAYLTYSKSANTVRVKWGDLNITIPVSTNGEPNDVTVEFRGNTTYVHADVPAQVINGQIMIPFEILGSICKGDDSPENYWTWYID